MARVTTEDCITSIPNRFQLVIYSCRRARELLSGNEANVAIDNDIINIPSVHIIRSCGNHFRNTSRVSSHLVSGDGGRSCWTMWRAIQ